MASIINASSTGSGGIVQTADASGVLQLQSNGTVALTVSTSAYVGVGTASPAAPLDVYVTRTSSTNAIAIILSDNVTGAQTNGVYKSIQSISNGTASKSEIRFLESDGTNNNTAIAFATSATAGGLTEKVRILNTGAIVCLSGGNTAATGTGIGFPSSQSASSDPNVLDDYEEGTWTPVATSQSGSITSYVSSGSYTKIGRTVTIYGNVQITNVGTASGQLLTSGMPFPTLSSKQYMGTVRETVATGNIFFVEAINSNAYIQNSTNGGITWATNYTYEFTVTYLT